MKRLFAHLTFLGLFAASSAMAQSTFTLDTPEGHREGEDVNYCGNLQMKQHMFNTMPGFQESYENDRLELEEFTAEWIRSKNDNNRGGGYVIPVVFHVIHEFGTENISDDQIYDAIDVMNEDFNLGNSDASNVESTFQGMPADVQVEFRLAQKKPNGGCFKGITRTYSSTSSTGSGGGWSNAQMSAVQNAQGTYPGDEYLNIFVVANADGAAGYTMTPNNWVGASMFNGIVILHNYVGSIGTSSAGRSRSLTHEVGHWLNLEHCWGGNNNPGQASACNDDDGVADTPKTIGHTSCNLNANTCSNETPGYWGSVDPNSDPVDNVENYMEYSYCSKMYTPGQRDRMHAALNSGVGGRNNLSTNGNLIDTGTDGNDILCDADFEAEDLVICAGSSVQFNDLTYHGATNWDWTFSGGNPANSTDENPTVTYDTPGVYDVSLTAGNGGTNLTESKTAYLTVLPTVGYPSPYTEGFENVPSIPSTDWMIWNPNDDNSKWEVTTATAYNGTSCVKINNMVNNEGNVDELMSTTIDLSDLTDVTLSFKYAYAQRNTGNNDRLSIYVSSDCGQSWSLRRNISGATLATVPTQNATFTPSSQNDWAHVDITNIVSSYLVDNFRFKFTFTSDEGNNIYLDDINLEGSVGINELNGNVSSFEVYPNPMAEVSTIAFNLNSEDRVSVVMLDVLGKEVMNIANQSYTAGEHKITFDKGALNAGVYVVRLRAGNQDYTKKVFVR